MTAPAEDPRTDVQRRLDTVLTIFRCPLCGARNTASHSDVDAGFARCADHGVYRAAGGLKLRDGDQPLPIPNGARDVQSQVIDDIVARRQVGIERYGTALQPNNGRDALRDAYEEALDLAMYLKQLILERDGTT